MQAMASKLELSGPENIQIGGTMCYLAANQTNWYAICYAIQLHT